MSSNWLIKRPKYINAITRKRKQTDAGMGELMNLLGGASNSEGPSLTRELGSDPETKLYVRDNHIFFQDDINFDTASALIREIKDLETELIFMQQQYEFPEPAPINLHITSPGGVIFAANGIIDCMNACRVPVNTIVDGFAASCGTLISIFGVKRSMGKNATMLIHQLSSGMWGHYTEAEQLDHQINIKQMSEKIRQFYADRTNMKKTELKEILKHDMDWDSDECLRRGLVDEIIE